MPAIISYLRVVAEKQSAAAAGPLVYVLLAAAAAGCLGWRGLDERKIRLCEGTSLPNLM